MSNPGRPWKRILCLLVCLAVARWAFYGLIRSKSFQIAGELVQRVETSQRVVALTFDDGPVEADADAVLACLARERVRATFFLVGESVERFPAATRRLSAAGHELGNHSFTHQRMVFKSPGWVRDEIERTDKALRSSGYGGPVLFRPPYGRKFIVLPLVLWQMQRTSVTWDVESPSEALPASGPASIVADVVTQVRPGSIVLLHVMNVNPTRRAATRAALPGIIAGLRERGYVFATVSELIGLRDRRPSNAP